MNPRPRLTLAAVTLLLLGVTSACTEKPPVGRDTPIRIAVPVIPPAIGNPYQGITIPSTLALQAVFDTVTSMDARGQVVPALALSWEQETPTEWLFRLRPGVRFSNGEPFTAEALVESARHMATLRGRGETIGSTLAQIESVEQVDALTARIRLSEPDPLLPLHASIWRIPAPAHWRTLKLPAGARNALGSGPFVLAGREEGRLVLDANPQAWRSPAAARLELLMIPDATARVQAFLSGAVDMAMVVSPDTTAAVARAGGRVVARLTPQVDLLAFRTERRASTPLKDPRVRRAMTLAVDRALLTRYVLGGATGPASQLSFPGAFGYDPALAPLPHDPAAARRLMAEAGYPEGFALTMMVTTGEVVGDTLYYQQIASDLKKIGIDVEIRGRPPARQMQDIFSGKLDVDLFSWNTRGTDPLNDYRHRSCLKSSPSRQPFHCDPVLTRQLHAAMVESGLGRRQALYAAIARYERDHPPGLMLWQRPDFDVVAANLDGYAPVQDMLHLERLARRLP